MDNMITGILSLVKSGLTGNPEPLPVEFSLEAAEEIVNRQVLNMLVFHGAVVCGIPADTPVMQRLRLRYLKMLLQSERQMVSVEALLRALDAAGADHMMVKGTNLKRLYPKPELRPMGDADILIRTEQYDRVKAVMEDLGYQFQAENHHVYEWSTNQLHVELHKTLIPPSDHRFYDAYGSGWRYARHVEGCRYEMNPEDAFVFLVVHFARHYLHSGIGCRHILDLYVYTRANPEMDWKYIEEELKKLRLWAFCRNVLWTLDVWFDHAPGDPVTEQITGFLFSGGDWGKLENQFYLASVSAAEQEGAATHSGWKAFVRAVFPPISTLNYRYSFLLRRPWLLPAVWVIRWVDLLFFRTGSLKRKFKALGSVNNTTTAAYIRALQDVGLDFTPEDVTE